MKNKMTEEDYIKKMLESVAKEEQISTEVEPAIMKKVTARKEYRDQIKLYRGRAKKSLIVSAVLLVVVGVISTMELMSGGDDPMQVLSLSAFSIVGILLIFIALQITKNYSPLQTLEINEKEKGVRGK